MELEKLSELFHENDIEWRIGHSKLDNNGDPKAMCLAYITNRAIMDRLDSVCGIGNWKNEFKEWKGNSQLCGISIYIECLEWVTKWDGADNTNIESTKGGLSDSMKRAAVQWGIGRYLYKLPVTWAIFTSNGRHTAKIGGNWFKWSPPKLSKQFIL